MNTLSVSISAKNQKYIDGLIRTGRYRSASELVGDALAALAARDAATAPRGRDRRHQIDNEQRLRDLQKEMRQATIDRWNREAAERKAARYIPEERKRTTPLAFEVPEKSPSLRV